MDGRVGRRGQPMEDTHAAASSPVLQLLCMGHPHVIITPMAENRARTGAAEGCPAGLPRMFERGGLGGDVHARTPSTTATATATLGMTHTCCVLPAGARDAVWCPRVAPRAAQGDEETDLQYHFRIATILKQSSRPLDALVVLDKVVTQQPHNADVLLLRGQCMEAGGNVPAVRSKGDAMPGAVRAHSRCGRQLYRSRGRTVGCSNAWIPLDSGVLDPGGGWSTGGPWRAGGALGCYAVLRPGAWWGWRAGGRAAAARAPCVVHQACQEPRPPTWPPITTAATALAALLSQGHACSLIHTFVCVRTPIFPASYA